jgi:hypothetical protein
MGDTWRKYTTDQVVDWLLEEDLDNAPVRFLALRDLLDESPSNRNYIAARKFMMKTGPIPTILKNQQPDGHWDRDDSIYYNKYTGTCWSVIMLAQMGADGDDARVKLGCKYIIEHGIGDHGGLSMNGRRTGAIHCLQGNLAAALIDLGFGKDPRFLNALDWMARSISGEGFSDSKGDDEDYYLRSGISGPGFRCSANNHEPCAWGAVKVALALSRVPEKTRSGNIEKAISACVNFLTSVDPTTAEYPHPWAPKPSTSWFKFGFPIFYVTDLLQILESLVGLGLRDDPKLSKAIDLVLAKREKNLCWLMEYTYNGKTWVNIEKKGQPSKWVTLRALRMLKNITT